MRLTMNPTTLLARKRETAQIKGGDSNAAGN